MSTFSQQATGRSFSCFCFRRHETPLLVALVYWRPQFSQNTGLDPQAAKAPAAEPGKGGGLNPPPGIGVSMPGSDLIWTLGQAAGEVRHDV